MREEKEERLRGKRGECERLCERQERGRERLGNEDSFPRRGGGECLPSYQAVRVV